MELSAGYLQMLLQLVCLVLSERVTDTMILMDRERMTVFKFQSCNPCYERHVRCAGGQGYDRRRYKGAYFRGSLCVGTVEVLLL